MSEFCQLDRELAHISAVIASLKISAPLNRKSPVMDPAYWRVRIREATGQAVLNSVYEQRILNLIAQLEAIPTVASNAAQT